MYSIVIIGASFLVTLIFSLLAEFEGDWELEAMLPKLKLDRPLRDNYICRSNLRENIGCPLSLENPDEF